MTPSAACHEILEGISSYLDGDLDQTACEAIESHCADCAACAALVNELRETVALWRQTAAVPLPESVRRQALESVRRLLDRGKP